MGPEAIKHVGSSVPESDFLPVSLKGDCANEKQAQPPPYPSPDSKKHARTHAHAHTHTHTHTHAKASKSKPKGRGSCPFMSQGVRWHSHRGLRRRLAWLPQLLTGHSSVSAICIVMLKHTHNSPASSQAFHPTVFSPKRSPKLGYLALLLY